MKSFWICFCLCFWVSAVNSSWAQYARFQNFGDYFPTLLQETVYEVEKHGWHNFLIQDQTVDINEQIYDRQFKGHVNYTNGFLVSMERIEAEELVQSFFQGLISFTTTGSMTCFLYFYNMTTGYDVSADLGEEGKHKMTGTFTHEEIKLEIRVDKNLNTSVITTSANLNALSAPWRQMEYLPKSAIGEALSRHFNGNGRPVSNSISSWARNVIGPAIKKAIERIGFPRVCFNCDDYQ